MRERLEKRLAELRSEFLEGQKTISGLESKLNGVRATVLRISGAIQVLEEELSLSVPDASASELAGTSDGSSAGRSLALSTTPGA
jgi:uncharacterized coiled-coil protein SlyX